jgi:predicted nucleotidyltransferase
MMSESKLTSLFSSRSLVRLLSAFLMNPERSYYQQELVRLTGCSLRPVQLALAKLEGADLIASRREGKQVYYRSVPAHPAFADLRSLFAKTFALADVLREVLAPLSGSIELAFVFGSMAAGDERAASDVFAVGSARRRGLAVVLGEAEARLGREVNLSLYSRLRLADAVASGDPFVVQVLQAPKIWLVGDDDELESMAG